MKEKKELIPGLNLEKSREYYERAARVLIKGSSDDFRGPPFWDPHAIAIERGEGSRIWDIDGNEYIDYLLGFGPLILGHSPARVIEAARSQMEKLIICGTPTSIEAEVAEKLHAIVPCAETVTFVNTGTEATMHALRFARGYTGKDKIVKFEGQYHGAHDYVLVSATDIAWGSRIAPYKVPLSEGIPQGALNTVITIPWNDPVVLEKTIKRHAHEIAGVLTEPAMANLGFIPPESGYLQVMRELTEANDIVLIFDEVKTGFRLAPGGGQEVYGVKPDLACFAKALGGGFAIGAIAGKREILESALRAGTFAANPVALAAANATLTELSSNGGAAYKHLYKMGNMLNNGLDRAIEKANVNMLIQGPGPIISWFFTKKKKIKDSRDFSEVDLARGHDFVKQMIKRGIYAHHKENFFISTAHTEADVEKTILAADESLRVLAN
jgi:glutamate-1-semialdehyde 2,1-aminomutase